MKNNDGTTSVFALGCLGEVGKNMYVIETNNEIDFISPGVKGQKVKMVLPIKCEKDWVIRRKK